MADATDRNHDHEMASKKHGTALAYKYVFGALGSNRLWRRNFFDKLGASSNSNGELFGDGGAAGTMVHTSVHYANQPCPRGSSAHRKSADRVWFR